MAAEEQTPDAPYVPHPISSVPAPDSASAPPLPDPISSVPTQPSGPPSSGVPISAVPASGLPAAVPPAAPRRKRRILLPIAIVLAVLVIGGGGVGLIAYDRATAIDRSTPSVSVQQFLTAVFVEEDSTRVALFLCSAYKAGDAMAHAHELVGTDAKASVGTVVVSDQSTTAATVDVRITLRYPGDFEPSGDEKWTFRMANLDGWRVCSFDLTG